MEGALLDHLAQNGAHGRARERPLKDQHDLVGICAAITQQPISGSQRCGFGSGQAGVGRAREREHVHVPSLDVSALTTLSNDVSSRCSMHEQTSNI